MMMSNDITGSHMTWKPKCEASMPTDMGPTVAEATWSWGSDLLVMSKYFSQVDPMFALE